MKINIKTYELKRVEKENTEFDELPEEVSYFFETGIRRSIRIVPIWTTWQKERDGKDEEIWKYHLTCVYKSFENIIESFEICLSDFEKYYNDNSTKLGTKDSRNKSIVDALLNKWLDKRTQEQFETDLNSAIKELNNFQK